MFFAELRSFKNECPTISGLGHVAALWLVATIGLVYVYA